MSGDQLNLDAILSAINDDLDTLGKPQTFEPGREHWRAQAAIQGNADALVAEVRRLRAAASLKEGVIDGLEAELRNLRAMYLDQGARLARVEALADAWNETPDYAPSDYDRGRVEQRHDMTTALLAAVDGP